MSGHVHHHHHHHNTQEYSNPKRLLWATLLNFSITLVQIVGGILSNSLSLMSDAIHNLGDSAAIFIAYIAGKISKREPDIQKTFGYKRVEILAALFNAVVLVVICLLLFAEAYDRFINPEPIKGMLMFTVASFGLLANLVSVIILHKDKSHNLNIRAAYLHLIGDTLSSIIVIGGGIAIYFYQIYWIDPIITVGVGLFIIFHTWGIIKQTVDILMQGSPSEIDLYAIKAEVENIEGINNIHHVHVWKLSDNDIHFEAHINVSSNMNMSEAVALKNKVKHILEEHFNINHITLETGYKCCDGDKELIKNSKIITTNENH